MNSRVVAYRTYGMIVVNTGGIQSTDKDYLKLAFPDIFENKDAKCNYFAISLPHDIFGYYILSQDMTLYYIYSTLGSCQIPTIPFPPDEMLVCDDTAEKNLSSKIDLNSVIPYGDPNWNCEEEDNVSKGVYF